MRAVLRHETGALPSALAIYMRSELRIYWWMFKRRQEVREVDRRASPPLSLLALVLRVLVVAVRDECLEATRQVFTKPNNT